LGLLNRIFRRRKPAEETEQALQQGELDKQTATDFIEEYPPEEQLTVEGKPQSVKEHYLKVIHMYGLSDVDDVQSELETGNIVIADIIALKKDGGFSIELKRAVEQMRGIVKVNNGDIAQLSERYIILTPAGIKIWRRSGESSGNI